MVFLEFLSLKDTSRLQVSLHLSILRMFGFSGNKNINHTFCSSPLSFSSCKSSESSRSFEFLLTSVFPCCKTKRRAECRICSITFHTLRWFIHLIPLWMYTIHKPRERYGFTDMLESAYPGHRPFYPQTEPGMRDGTVLAKVKVPL